MRREPSGPVVRIVGTHLDITERKRTEAALRESQERLTLAFAGAQRRRLGLEHRNQRGRVFAALEADARLCRGRNRTAHQRLGASGASRRSRRAPTRRTTAWRAASRTYEAEFRLRHKDGRYVHVLSRGFPVRREPGGPVVRIVGTHFDLTERKEAEELLRRSHEELEVRVRERTAELARANESLRAEMGERERADRARTELLARLVFAQEDERRRIAREMHDQFGEQLTALGHRIASLKDACGDRLEPARTRSRRSRRSRSSSIATSITSSGSCGRRRSTISACRPRSPTTSRTGRSARASPPSCTPRGCCDDRLASEAETTLYRIAQEALTNVAKHSRAKHVDVILERRADQVLLIVEDDGVGFDPGDAGDDAGDGLGLLGHAGARVAGRRDDRNRIGRRQGHDDSRADGGAACGDTDAPTMPDPHRFGSCWPTITSPCATG